MWSATSPTVLLCEKSHVIGVYFESVHVLQLDNKLHPSLKILNTEIQNITQTSHLDNEEKMYLQRSDQIEVAELLNARKIIISESRKKIFYEKV